MHRKRADNIFSPLPGWEGIQGRGHGRIRKMRDVRVIMYRECSTVHALLSILPLPGMYANLVSKDSTKSRYFCGHVQGRLYYTCFFIGAHTSRPVHKAPAQRFNKILAFLAIMYRQSRSVQASPWSEPYILRRTRYANG